LDDGRSSTKARWQQCWRAFVFAATVRGSCANFDLAGFWILLPVGNNFQIPPNLYRFRPHQEIAAIDDDAVSLICAARVAIVIAYTADRDVVE